MDRLVPLNPRVALVLAALLAAAIAVVDSFVTPSLSIGLLYLFPILVLSGATNPASIAIAALVCDLLREQFSPDPWGPGLLARFVTAYLAYLGAGLLGWETVRNRRQSLERIRQLNEQIRLRESAEQQVRALVEGSPAALLVVDPAGKVVLANDAARELLQCGEERLEGQSIDGYLPTLAELRKPSGVRRLVRTMLECTGYRRGGEAFLAHVWVSSTGPPSVTGLSALVFDASEQLRSREEGALHTLALNARVLLGEYWHEIRNLATALRMVASTLMRMPAIADVEEITALDSLVKSLENASAAGLQPESEESFDIASLRSVLEQFRIIVTPWFEEIQAPMRWEEARNLPLIRANHHALLQVFINLARNARRAVEDSERKEIIVSAALDHGKAVVRFRNSGQPIADPAKLFQPFQPGAAATGLGLHVSRAILRSFGGNLRYDREPGGSCFTVELEPRKVSEIFENGKR